MPKVVDTAVLAMINENFTLAPSQFGFQQRVPITQVLIQANDNTPRGLKHAAILDLKKAYDKVNRTTLIEVEKECLDTNLLNMVREMITCLYLQT